MDSEEERDNTETPCIGTPSKSRGSHQNTLGEGGLGSSASKGSKHVSRTSIDTTLTGQALFSDSPTSPSSMYKRSAFAGDSKHSVGIESSGRRPKRKRFSRSLFSGIFLVLTFLLPFILLLLVLSFNTLPSATNARELPFSEDESGVPPAANPTSHGRDHHKHSNSTDRHRHHKSSRSNSNSIGITPDASCTGCPVVESIEPDHGPTLGNTVLTITGRDFGDGPQGLHAVAVGDNPCRDFKWVSESEVWCWTPKGTGSELEIAMTVRTLTGYSREVRFSYDAPVVQRVELNHAPRAGGTTVIIKGSNFGNSESFPIATIGGKPCTATKWVTNEAVRCVVPEGHGVRLAVHVMVCGCGAAVQRPQSSALVPNALFSYHEDTMRDSASAILKGLPIKMPKVPLTMNGKQIQGQYEMVFTDPVTSKTHYLSVPPELLSTLPAADYKHRYDTCAIVGNSGSLTAAGLGSTIDDHDAVFRFHNAPTHKFEADVGSKTTFQVLDQYWVDALMNNDNGPQDAKWWVEDATLVLWSPFSQEAFVQLRQLFPTTSIIYLSRNLVTITASAAAKMKARIADTMDTSFSAHWEVSSVLYALVFALQVCNQVDVYGTDARAGKYHYYEEYDPGSDERDSLSLEFLMYLVLQSTGHIHSIQEQQMAKQSRAGGVEAAEEPKLQCQQRDCVNDCSHRGVFKNGVCQCEPIYTGSDCSINLMEKEMPRLLQGLNTTYSGPIMMNKAEVNGTSITLPKGITHDKMGKNADFYTVDRQLYHAIPDADSLERYGSCAIVGNSGSMLNKEYGRDVDAHDLVYRFNQAPVKGYEHFVGSRSTFESLNGYWVKELLDEKRGYRWNWRSRDTGIVFFELFDPAGFIWKTKTQIVDKDRWWKQSFAKLRKIHPDRKLVALSPQFVSWIYLLYRELRRRFQRMHLGNYPGEKPMSGFYAFFFALQVCESVDIYGFAPYSEGADHEALDAVKYHYFDSAVPRPGSHSFDLARYIYQLFELKYDNVRIFD